MRPEGTAQTGRSTGSVPFLWLVFVGVWAACYSAEAQLVVYDTTNTAMGSQSIWRMTALTDGTIAVTNSAHEVWRAAGNEWTLLGRMADSEKTDMGTIVPASDSTVWYPTLWNGIGLLGTGVNGTVDSSNSCIGGFWAFPLGVDVEGLLVASYGSFVENTTVWGLNGVSRMSGDSCRPIATGLPSEGPWFVTHYTRDSLGGEWFMYQSSLLQPQDDSLYRVLNGVVTRPDVELLGHVRALRSGPSHTYIGMTGSVCVVPNGGASRYLDEIGGVALVAVNAVLVDSREALWLGTSRGLYRVLQSDTTLFDTTSGVPSNVIMSLEEDHEGRIWIGTHEHGVAVYTYPDSRVLLQASRRREQGGSRNTAAVELHGRRINERRSASGATVRLGGSAVGLTPGKRGVHPSKALGR